MNRRAFLYGLWCLGLLGVFLIATVFGYSPFADGGGMRGGRASFYGPSHK